MPSLPNADVGHRLSRHVGRRLTAISACAKYAQRMSTLVYRKSVDDERVGGPFSCASPHEMTRVPGLLTLEERMPWLVAAHETAGQVEVGHIKIYRGGKLVGYIVVLSND